MKKLIGLGCSWAEGEGGYPEHIWKQYNGRTQEFANDISLRKHGYENSWVNVLCREHLSDYTPVNLGVRGIGNKAAVKQLYLTDEVNWETDEGIIVLLLSGIERLDVFNNTPHEHYRYNTAWPNEHDPPKLFWEAYRKELYGEPMVCMESLTAILEAQTIAERYNFKLVIANAYNPTHIIDHFNQHIGKKFTNLVNWNNYIHTAEDINFIEKLVKMDELIPPDKYHSTSYWSIYPMLDWPAKYLTNCIHPTIDGYKVIAKDLYTFIDKKNII